MSLHDDMVVLEDARLEGNARAFYRLAYKVRDRIGAAGLEYDEYGIIATYIASGDSPFRMRWVKPGRFVMGTRQPVPQEMPQREADVADGFWLGETTVTEGMCARAHGRYSAVADPRVPVDTVDWAMAQSYVKRISRACGVRFRLPEEVEWEYACRAGTTTATWVGDFESAGRDQIERIAWVASNSGDRIQPVGTKEANPWGFRDMLGNVWEWCSDETPSETQGGWVLPPRRVARGGCCRSSAREVHASARCLQGLWSGAETTGFRLAADLLAALHVRRP